MNMPSVFVYVVDWPAVCVTAPPGVWAPGGSSVPFALLWSLW